MTIKIDARLSRALLEQPETGMGYQVVEVMRKGAEPGYAVIANATELLQVLGRARYVSESARESRLLELELKYPSPETRIRALRGNEAKPAGLQETGSQKGSGPGNANPVEGCPAGEKFFRFSADPSDPRILADGSVKAGTYVTTFSDGAKVKTGIEAVERYALPNPEPAVYRFHLEPRRSIRVRRGTVQPAFGHAGGGDEAIFEEGAPARTHRQEEDRRLPRGDE